MDNQWPKHTTYNSSPAYNPSNGLREAPKNMPREISTPRKDPVIWRKSLPPVPSPASAGSLPFEAQSSDPSEVGAHEPQHGARAHAPSFSRPMNRASEMTSMTEQVLEKAQSNSTHTDVIETMAPGKFLTSAENELNLMLLLCPAVVHETIHQEVHEIRQEVITREIHNHEYYHRILPIVDVEVLPARHFLPVEGGGLVEISGDDVPGRGRQWVIAETASKIRSDQPAPQSHSRFSAREFAGSEGARKKYITPDGVERTEQTWVHPPELESGARETGQTWPLVLDDDVGSSYHHRPGSPHQSPLKKAAGNRPVEAQRF